MKTLGKARALTGGRGIMCDPGLLSALYPIGYLRWLYMSCVAGIRCAGEL